MPRTTVAATVTRDAALLAVLATHADYPGPSAQLDAADRAWLAARGVVVPRPAAVPLAESARLARLAKRACK